MICIRAYVCLPNVDGNKEIVKLNAISSIVLDNTWNKRMYVRRNTPKNTDKPIFSVQTEIVKPNAGVARYRYRRGARAYATTCP